MSGLNEDPSTPGEEYEKVPLSRNVTSQPVRDGDDQELRRIASAFSFPQRQITIKEDPELYEDEIIKGTTIDDPTLDPTSGSFDSYKWAKNVLSVLNKEGISLKKASIVFKDLNVSGTGSALQLQKNVLSPFMAPFRAAEYLNIGSHRSPEKQILRDFDGCLKSGELLMVLGRPGSGCSTLLKSICGQMKGLKLQKGSSIHYGGIPSEKMHKEFKGEVIYNQEVDKHFANLTVGQTLEFAASARTPQARPHSMTREQFIKYTTSITMAVYGLSHTYNTNVGSDYIRGVSGGERKRVSIAEMALAGAPISAWDNSTRGLDAATALEFVKSLRMSSDLFGSCHAVAIYQASQAIYDVFDKVVVLYEGKEIFFGSCDQAGEYFQTMGWYCPPRQTTGDFLTSVTNPQERKPREGFEDKVPRTAEEFARHWKNSREYAALKKEIDQHESDFPVGDDAHLGMREAKTSEQSKHLRPESPYIISIPMQIKICTKRSFQRLWNSKSGTIAQVVSQIVMALIVGSIFFGTPNDSAVFFSKGAAIFLAILFNALSSISEINTLYDQRPIVEKHASYAFYHPFADAFGSVVSDIPVKFVTAIFFNIVLYFMVGLRQEAAQFFIYFLFAFISTLCMSVMFRTLAAATKTLAQAMALSGIMVLAINIYTGFSVTVPYMKVWFSWIRFINPVFYGFEALIANEFHGRQFPCASYVPPLSLATGNSFICSSVGAVEGETFVSGDTFIAENYQYYYSHIWRNLGIIIAFWIGFFFAYLLATELNSSFSSSAEFLVFRRGQVPAYIQNMDKTLANDETVEAPEKAVENDDKNDETDILPPQRDFFTWRNVCYDIPTKDGERRLLDNVSGWIKPGTLTALMGVSGAGKTTLLDVLAQRVSMGVITGDMLVNGNALPASFQRNTGYCQQQDLHLETTTVREALQFSAILRQPKTVPKQEKLDYVENVVKMLHMKDFADAVVGKTGEGLNVEQRKLLSIGVELAAKPKLLLFLDEPTSGLDSQSSWSICSLLRSLAENGQAILCTIHQPSAILFQEFDRLLFLAKGGKTVYFGDIGKESRTLLDYFETNGARHCDDSENPAEYMLEVIGAGASGESKQDWPTVWNNSQETKDVQSELDRIHKEMSSKGHDIEAEDDGEFAMPFSTQLWEVTRRVFQQYWVQPGYIYSKLLLGVAAALFIGFSFFKPDSSQQGLQTALFSVFQLMAIFSTIVQQIIPKFITQRSLYEVRERPAKTYSWSAFLIANIVVEIPWQIFLGVVVWASFYFSVFTANQTPEQQALMVLFCVELFVFASTFADFITAAIPNGETAGSVVTLLFALSLIFCGVLQPPDSLPGFWIFMYRVSPLTYLVAGMTATGLHGREIQCSSAELSIFQPPPNQTCGQYLATYLQAAPGQLYNPSSMTDCEYCPLSNADQYLASSNIYFSERWRNFGILLAYIGFNIFAATAMYYLFRVKQWKSSKVTQKTGDAAEQVEQLFKVREGKTPKGREAENDRVF